MHGPLAQAYIKVLLRLSLRTDGYSFRDVNDVLAGLNQYDIDLANALTSAKLGQPIPVAGDTPILDRIREFLNSEFGKAFLEILKMILLGLL